MRVFFFFFLLALPAAASTAVLTLPATLEARCKKQKDPGSCYELGDFYRKTSQPAVIAEGTALLLYGCAIEKKRDCTEQEAKALAAINVRGRKLSDAKSEEILQSLPTEETEDERGCRAGDAKACHGAALYHLYLAPVVNPKKARALYEEGCRLGDQDSCGTLELIRKNIIHVFDVAL